MKNFNIKPSKQFYNFIKNISIKKNSISLNKKYKYPFFKLNGIIFKRYKSKYIKISSNQFRIIDSLFEDGGKKIYDYNKSKKYSEHSGLIDFNINSLERIIVNATPNYIDKNDESIFLPNNMIDEADYELIFHTHPYTPDRIDEGIILDLPSIGDILNFADNYIEGYTQGSLVITREGLYIIKILDDKFGIKYPKKKDIDNLTNEFNNLLESIYYKYYTNYTDKLFYSKIINDISFLETYNKLLEKYNLYIDYYPRIKLNKIYVIPDIKIKLNIIESKLKNKIFSNYIMKYSIVIPNGIKDELLEGLASATSLPNYSFDSPFSALFERGNDTLFMPKSNGCGSVIKIMLIIFLIFLICKILMKNNYYEFYDNKKKNNKYI